jgi:chromosome segregation ATPase
MKIVVTIALLFFSLSSFALDLEALKTERTSLREAMKSLEQEFDSNETVGERLSQRISDLQWSAKQVEKQVHDLQAKSDALDAKLAQHGQNSADLDVRLANHEASVHKHNGECGGTYEDQSYVDWCNNKAATLNAAGATLDREVDDFNAAGAALTKEVEHYNELTGMVQQLIENQETQEALVNQEIERYEAHRQELIDAGLKIQARLDEIQGYIDTCEAAIASGSDEAMKAECGSMFDGN